MHKDFDDLKKILTWILKKKSYLPCSANILTWIWYFKRNLVPNGSIMKYKAWLCVRVDVWKRMVIASIDTYTPSMFWYRVLIVLIMICIFDPKIHAVDFINTCIILLLLLFLNHISELVLPILPITLHVRSLFYDLLDPIWSALFFPTCFHSVTLQSSLLLFLWYTCSDLTSAELWSLHLCSTPICTSHLDKLILI